MALDRVIAEPYPRLATVLDDEAAQQFPSVLEQPSPDSERGLRRLVEKPNVLPEA
jgi:hypothetical protein